MLRIIDGNNVIKRYFHTMGTDALLTLYLQSISEYPAITTIMWCWDGKGSNDRRKALYPDYKGKRPPSSDEFHQVRDLFKEMLTHSSCLSIEIPGYEADDVIAKIALGTDAAVEIVSSDVDFAALDKPNIILLTDYPSKIPKDQIRLYKVLVGDTSDNIPGLKGFGSKAWENLSEHEMSLIKRFIEQTDVLGGDEVADELQRLGWKPAMVRNFREQAEQLQTFYQVINFFDVPDYLIQTHLKAGKLNQEWVYEKCNSLLFGG